MEKITLNANLVDAIQKYLVSRPFGEVANLVLALQQQISAQLPRESVIDAQGNQQTPEQVQ